MKHLIKKQELLLAVAPGLEPFAMQHAASRYYHDILLPALERVFDELSVEEEVIHIDRLLIDIGAIALKNLQNGAPGPALYATIKKELQKTLNGERPETGVLRTALRANALAQWWYYMEKGRLPWNADGITGEWHRQILEILATDFASITRLRQALAKGGPFLQRITLQHPAEFLGSLTGILTGARQPALGRQVEDFCFLLDWLEIEYRRSVNILPDQGERRRDKNASLTEGLHRWARSHTVLLSLTPGERIAAVWGRLILEAALRPETLQAGATALLSQWLTTDMDLRQWIHDHAPGIRALTAPIPEEPAKTGIPPSPANPLPDKESPILKDKRSESTDEDAKDLAEKFRQEEGADKAEIRPDEITESPDAEDPEEAHPASDSNDLDEEGLYGRYAGLVLLHPFLSTFFSRLHLWDGGGFISLAARQQAVLLLHYLATGEKEAPEYELVFPKLLCGFRLEAPLPKKRDLPEAAFEEADELLQNVLLRWEKLKNSSVGGLREGFLQRTGKLFNRNGRLVLLLESSAIDVLLDYLPWNLSIVKLPWLKDLLYVEWR